MNNYCILRFGKIKSLAAISAAERHGKIENRKYIKTISHPELTKQNFIEYKYPDISLVNAFKKETENIKVRKNSVMLVETIFTFSPESSYLIKGKEKLWYDASINWLKKVFPDAPILLSRLEYDESTTHMHVYFVPLIKKDGNIKLSCKELLGNKYQLHDLQTSYAMDMSKFGLERGKSYLDIKEENFKKPYHKTLKEYYREINNENDIYEDLFERIEHEKQK